MNAQRTSYNLSDEIKWLSKESFVEVEVISYSEQSAFFSPNFIVCFSDSDKAASICNAEGEPLTLAVLEQESCLSLGLYKCHPIYTP